MLPENLFSSAWQRNPHPELVQFHVLRQMCITLFSGQLNKFLAINHCYWKSCWHCLHLMIPYLAFVSQSGQTNCCPLFETKDAHSRERIDIAIASKNQYDGNTAA